MKVRGGHHERIGLQGAGEKGEKGRCRCYVRTCPSNTRNGIEHNQTKREGAREILFVLSSVFIKHEETYAH